ncbi:MAG TPA: TonB-dependent receptor, partial [Bacteroidota bacterium]|nr:TonB-dependent receptor [Bacteroidota bacterium]
RTSYGKSFHAPVFNDLYWIEGGNPQLRPERAYSFDAGLRSEVSLAGTLSLDASYFSIDSRDRIVWIPSGGTFWSPKNIASARSRGVEAEASWKALEGALTLTLNSTWTDVKKTSADYPGDPTQGKQLIYEPPQMFHATAELHLSGVGFYVRHSWTSYRYTTEVNDEFLGSYGVTSLAARYELTLGPVVASAKLEVDNLFNTSYQVIALYPMPLRQMRLTMQVGI